jgi:small subunit ribosomal protein S8e
MFIKISLEKHWFVNIANKKIFKSILLSLIMNNGKKISGGKYLANRNKKLFERPGQERKVKFGEEEKRRTKKTKGGNRKVSLSRAKYVNVQGAKGQKKLEIKNVLETPSNRFLARQNIITKGTILETESGKVRVTNRPSQHGIVNGILVK